MAVSARSIREQNLTSIETSREGARHMADVTRQATEATEETIRTAVETASRAFQGSAEQIARSFGLSDRPGQDVSRQATQTIEAITECSAILVRGFQEISHEWLSLAQHRFQRNLEGVRALASSQNMQDVVAAQTELVRDNIQQIVENSRQIADSSVRIADEAAQTLTGKRNSPRRR